MRHPGTRRPTASTRRPRISPTKLNTYLACPRQYYFAYLAKYPRRPRAYYSFGSSLHAALQDFHREGGAGTQQVETLLSNLEDSWVAAGYASSEEQAERLQAGQEMLAAYYQHAEAQQAETILVEKMLSLPQEEFVLAGRVDRVDRWPDGLVEVVDYKSGSYLPGLQELEEDLAVGIYQLLVSRTLETTPVKGTIYNLRANESVSILRDEPALVQVEERVRDIYSTLSADSSFTPRPGSQCLGCDFVPYCPAGRSLAR